MKKTNFSVLGMIAIIIFAANSLFAADFYVSKAVGVNKNEGTKQAPLKNLQNALRKAKAGDKIYVAQGNYLGLLDRGYIEINKAVEIYGGYSSDFRHRDITVCQHKHNSQKQGSDGNQYSPERNKRPDH